MRLNPPETLIQPQVSMQELVRAQLSFRRKVNFLYVYVEQGGILGYVHVQARWGRRDEWTITTLAALDRAPSYVPEELLEEVCRAAGEQGVLRLFAKIPRDEPGLQLFRGLGFTHYTNEHIWGNLYVAADGVVTHAVEPQRASLRSQTNADAWNLMQLYSAVTPPAVQRAEMLNSSNWRRSSMPRPLFLSQGLLEKAYVWPDRSRQDGLGGYVRLVIGPRGDWITTMFRPDTVNRGTVPLAFDYALWKAARYGSKPVYCGIRDYQVEMGSILEARGFHHLSEQAMLVKYLAEPIKAKQPSLVPFLARNTGELVPTKFQVESLEG